MIDVELQQLLKDKHFVLAANRLCNDAKLLKEAMQLFFNKNWQLNQQISNVFEELKKEHQHLLQPFFGKWIKALETPTHNAFWRNSYRYFQDVEIPEKHRGLLYGLAFNDMMNVKSPIAIKAFAMKTCVNIAKHHPDLLPELRQAIVIVSDSDSPGVRNRAKHMIKAIDFLL